MDFEFLSEYSPSWGSQVPHRCERRPGALHSRTALRVLQGQHPSSSPQESERQGHDHPTEEGWRHHERRRQFSLDGLSRGSSQTERRKQGLRQARNRR
ncbi:hypothetical protein BC835DRAFT_535470 [Cytidiella melzeri]|nr:hypothetical protein BC835DRAFT_535470 [Cytidiella melzeri]